jgi:hypothetical protein
MRNDRVQVAPGQLRANAYAKFTADRLRAARPVLVAAGRYDRAAIMRAAIQQAQSRRAVTGEAWGVCLSAALKGVWSVEGRPPRRCSLRRAGDDLDAPGLRLGPATP